MNTIRKIFICKNPVSCVRAGNAVPDENARFIAAELRDDALHVWAIADSAAPIYNREFLVLGTNDEFPEAHSYIGTVFDAGVALHVCVKWIPFGQLPPTRTPGGAR